MYCIIQNGKITGISENYISSENGTTIEKDFTQEEIKKINSGYSYNIETGEFEETPESIEFEKQSMIDELKDLAKQGEELRSKYLSAELLPESEIKTETLRILKEKGDLIMSQYVEKQKILVEKYGVEILQEIL